MQTLQSRAACVKQHKTASFKTNMKQNLKSILVAHHGTFLTETGFQVDLKFSLFVYTIKNE